MNLLSVLPFLQGCGDHLYHESQVWPWAQPERVNKCWVWRRRLLKTEQKSRLILVPNQAWTPGSAVGCSGAMLWGPERWPVKANPGTTTTFQPRWQKLGKDLLDVPKTTQSSLHKRRACLYVRSSGDFTGCIFHYFPVQKLPSGQEFAISQTRPALSCCHTSTHTCMSLTDVHLVSAATFKSHILKKAHSNHLSRRQNPHIPRGLPVHWPLIFSQQTKSLTLLFWIIHWTLLLVI